MAVDIWEKYEQVKKYNNSFRENGDYYSSVKTWYNFYEGNQWLGVSEENNLPKPVFNICKRILDFKVASLTSDSVSVNVEILNNQGLEEDVASIINAEIDNVLEKTKFEYLIRDCLTDAGITGDMCVHVLFNPNADTYVDTLSKGQIELELIDSVNVGFGNPNIKDVDKQPWIILMGRDTVTNLKKEAKEKSSITSDNMTEYQASKYTELDQIKPDGSDGKALYIYVYEKDKNGKVFVSKCTENAVIFEKRDTGLTCYPIAFENWYNRKNSYHGRGEIEGICPNQLFLNKAMAMVEYHTMQTAFPPTIINTKKIKNLSNKIGGLIKIDLETEKGETFGDIVKNLEPVNMSNQITNVIEMSMSYTKETLGISDASLGNIDPKNTSAIIAVQKSNAIPLENIKSNLYCLVEQIVIILIDMMATKYGTRPLYMKNENGRYTQVSFDFSQLKNMDKKLNVDVGSGSYYSEISLLQTLDNLLMNGQISLLQYLERIPDKLITKKQELIDELKNQQEVQANNYERMAQFFEQLPLEEQQRLQQLPPEKMEAEIMAMMGGGAV